eukprot:TRINITY_DN17500_c0_g1_i1.p1 TRINITY_DN17500_c0_g1~~TRINITY_DN17500_c0_g1_i1.p1  ORF type:complete len:699 (+),score=194.84 TRINITY_DN17500_c0_g1_i1:71-2167(+)
MGDDDRSKRINSQIQMNIATACLSARYSEIARKASREAGQRPAVPRKGSPASRPKAGLRQDTLPPRTPSPRVRMGHESVTSYSPSHRTGSPAHSYQASPKGIRNCNGIRRSINTTPSPALPVPVHTSPASVSSFDYLQKATASDVSPLVKSLSKHLGQMESHISDSLNKNKIRQSSGHRSVTAIPPPSVAARELHLTQATTPGATSMRYVSPPRRPGTMRTDTTPPKTTAQNLTLLHSELGRVRQGIGAVLDPVSRDWEWNNVSPAAMMAEFMVSTHREMWEMQLWNMREIVEVGRRSANVFKASALIRDLSISSTHAAEVTELTEKNTHLVDIVNRMEDAALAVYAMEHSSIETTQLVLKEDGKHSSDVGHGTYVFARRQATPHMFITLSWNDDCKDVELVSTDHGKSWKSVDADTVRLHIDSGIPLWLRNEALSCEMNAANHHNVLVRTNEQKLKEEVSRLQAMLAERPDADTDEIRKIKQQQKDEVERARAEEEAALQAEQAKKEKAAEEKRIEEERKAQLAALREEKIRAEKEQREKELREIEVMKAAEEMRLAEERRFAQEVKRAEELREQQDREERGQRMAEALKAAEEEELKQAEELKLRTELELEEEKRLLAAEEEELKQAEELKLRTELELEEEKRLLAAEKQRLGPPHDALGAALDLDPSLDHSHLDPNIFADDDADFEPDFPDFPSS